MRRKRPLCVHCVRAEGVTDDHGVPLSWYPLSSAPDHARVKAPACRACNARLKMLEEEVLVPLILSIDPRDGRVAGIAERIRRSTDVAHARDEKDARARAAKRARLEAQIFVPESDVGAFPGAEREGRSAEALPLRGAAIEAIAEKVARVVLYAAYRQYVPLDRRVQAHIVRHGEEMARIAVMIRGGETFDVPPGISVAVRRAADDPATVLAVVDLWGRFRVFASILPPDVVLAAASP